MFHIGEDKDKKQDFYKKHIKGQCVPVTIK